MTLVMDIINSISYVVVGCLALCVVSCMLVVLLTMNVSCSPISLEKEILISIKLPD